MRQFALAVGFGAGLLLLAGRADAQYRYTDDKGVSKVTQYKLDVPERYRDAAVWVGPTGVGKPALSAEAQQQKQLDDAQRRIIEADMQLRLYGQAEEQREQAQGSADFMNASRLCQSVVNGNRKLPGGKTFRAQAYANGSVSTLGTDHSVFAYEQCMARQRQPVQIGR